MTIRKQVICLNTSNGIKEEPLMISMATAASRAHWIFIEIICRKVGRERTNLETKIVPTDRNSINVPPHVENMHVYPTKATEVIRSNGSGNARIILDLVATRDREPARSLQM
ncbi:hypothetical protein KP509_20G037400 [Ceratopteris richardii]|uniref:Uncharacterized protein n=1 Tax=Ceratopteris richardii TaxID=49495 RepID=A0A8T2SEH8_CERRI|nr:hypothetical protein KP509_20G037400 [Ceratopteris richardii]